MNVSVAISGHDNAIVAPRPRDPRLDFFRGLGMFIILVAHIPWNSWTNLIPVRFGFSDAADMFVFCSGMASSIAFGSVFEQRGWWLGAARIAQRVWQVYWAHIGSFFVVAALMAGADLWFGGDNYVRQLALHAFFDHAAQRLPHLLTLTYVPEYFDILPMYLAILAMVPLVMALARIDTRLVFVFMGASWLAAFTGHLWFTADMTTGRGWFFNPFAWQLVFFSGFSLMRGWWPAPPRDRRLVGLAVAIVVFAAPVSCQDEFSCHAGWGYVPLLGDIHNWLIPVIQKTDYGPLRYVHFMATVYLAWYVAGERGVNLTGPVVDLTRRVGQQTLAVFLTGLVTAQLLGIVFDHAGRGFLVSTLVNLAGFAVLIAAALLVAWFKSSPWRRKHAHAVTHPL